MMKSSVITFADTYEVFTPHCDVGTIYGKGAEKDHISRTAVVKRLFNKAHHSQLSHSRSHNLSPTRILLPFAPKIVFLFAAHQNNIAASPYEYIKESNKHFSIKRKIFDLLVGGPLAAIADTISSIALFIIAFSKTVKNGAIGLKDYALSKGQKTDMLKEAKKSLRETCISIYQLVRSAIRIIPGLGVFGAHAFSVGVKAIEIAMEESGKIDKGQAPKYDGL